MTAKKKTETLTVDVDFALARAAAGLDEIMQMARERKDTASALEVISGWFTLAALLDIEADDEEDEDKVKKHKTGFHHE